MQVPLALAFRIASISFPRNSIAQVEIFYKGVTELAFDTTFFTRSQGHFRPAQVWNSMWRIVKWRHERQVCWQYWLRLY